MIVKIKIFVKIEIRHYLTMLFFSIDTAPEKGGRVRTISGCTVITEASRISSDRHNQLPDQLIGHQD